MLETGERTGFGTKVVFENAWGVVGGARPESAGSRIGRWGSLG